MSWCTATVYTPIQAHARPNVSLDRLIVLSRVHIADRLRLTLLPLVETVRTAFPSSMAACKLTPACIESLCRPTPADGTTAAATVTAAALAAAALAATLARCLPPRRHLPRRARRLARAKFQRACVQGVCDAVCAF